MRKALYFLFALAILLGCGVLNKKNKGKGMNLFTVQQDKQLGAQVAAEIDGNPAQYPILDSASNVEAYQMIYRVRDAILNSGEVDFKDDFTWRLRIINDDNTLNAFCTPGGYIYVYTGILKYLDNEAQLAGVMGHEIAHADQRHSTRQMTKMFGVQVLLDILAGNSAMLKEVTSALVGLRNSRAHEKEADEFSVKYLCPTPYDAAGGAGFFEKINNSDAQRPPEFLSTHPDPGKRIETFYNTKTVLGCTGSKTSESEYKRIVNRL
ncbi:MAG: M48 family metalloprotease [Crocinitomicaceae bacterium]|jgi:predicted Zn-dependent protease|nr:M48 family metalloprotease [Crocinitomicaceae bacterium]